MDINKIAKEMTREEFLNSKYVREVDEEGYITYKCIEDYIFTIDNCLSNCKECWEDAIKDIKFKGDVNIEFDWEGFRRNKFAVLCDTEEKARDFIKQCYINKMNWINAKQEDTFWDEWKDETCYSNDFNYDNKLGYGIKSFYLDNGYEVIEWEIENLKKDKEYSIQDILNMQEELEFIGSNGLPYKIKNGYLYVYFIKKDKWDESGNSIQEILNMTFTLRYKIKKVTFEEAIQAYGKEIYCVFYDGMDKIKTSYKLSNEYYQFDGDTQYSICPKQILHGEWHIKED